MVVVAGVVVAGVVVVVMVGVVVVAIVVVVVEIEVVADMVVADIVDIFAVIVVGVVIVVVAEIVVVDMAVVADIVETVVVDGEPRRRTSSWSRHFSSSQLQRRAPTRYSRVPCWAAQNSHNIIVPKCLMCEWVWQPCTMNLMMTRMNLMMMMTMRTWKVVVVVGGADIVGIGQKCYSGPSL